MSPPAVFDLSCEQPLLGLLPEATQLLVDVNRLAHSRQEADLDAPEGTERFRFGVYFYREDQAGKPGTGTADRKGGRE